ncbi:inactive pancreatic lipase-related protein 1-like [Bacillus rossius redtenbacheri]|uniref:inactive pancreatic lipase-related protein 1-like n=1 Tax=Bacillus rossius redtenbacheri TaxID=93214 RepID=UPI002FDEE398
MTASQAPYALGGSEPEERGLSRKDYGRTWIYMPDGDGVPRVAILEVEGKSWQHRRKDARLDLDEDIVFQLYTRESNSTGHPVRVNDTQTLKSAGFDPRKDLKVVVHGWKSSGDSRTVGGIKDAYLEADDVNVVVVDWSRLASNIVYYYPASNTKPVGRRIADLVRTLEAAGAERRRTHLVGHSLGAHVVGYAGQALRPDKVARVTGLDPALPLFQYWAGPEDRLDQGDAEFVDVIHTCSNVLGYGSPVGHADFYPNGGSTFQPGCCCLPEFVDACSHSRSHQYFAESITSTVGFRSLRCDTWSDFEAGRCDNATAVDMGEKTPPE